MGVLRAGCVALALALVALPVPAQTADTSATEVVSVNISDLQMLADLARTLHVGVGQIPVMVQVSIQLAARVCGVKVKWLRKNAVGDPLNCDATTISPAFRTAVAEQLLAE
jgi:hypothetical protein